MSPDLSYAEGLAASLPTRDDEADSDLISLVDIVITGVETPFNNFGVLSYKPEADGVTIPWVTLVAHPGVGADLRCDLYESTVRNAVRNYLQNRLDAGVEPSEAARLIDGSYTDAMVADSILQFALYGEEVFS